MVQTLTSYEVFKVIAIVIMTILHLHKLSDKVKQFFKCTILIICIACSSADGENISFIT